MREKIHIDKPCSVDWNKMTPDKEGKFCGSCQKVVVDFTSKSLDEVKSHFLNSKDSNFCGRYKIDHTSNSNVWHNIVNAVENFFLKIKLHRFAILLTTILLFLSACRRHIQGCPTYLAPEKNKINKQEVPK